MLFSLKESYRLQTRVLQPGSRNFVMTCLHVQAYFYIHSHIESWRSIVDHLPHLCVGEGPSWIQHLSNVCNVVRFIDYELKAGGAQMELSIQKAAYFLDTCLCIAWSNQSTRPFICWSWYCNHRSSAVQPMTYVRAFALMVADTRLWLMCRFGRGSTDEWGADDQVDVEWE